MNIGRITQYPFIKKLDIEWCLFIMTVLLVYAVKGLAACPEEKKNAVLILLHFILPSSWIK